MLLGRKMSIHPTDYIFHIQYYSLNKAKPAGGHVAWITAAWHGSLETVALLRFKNYYTYYKYLELNPRFDRTL